MLTRISQLNADFSGSFRSQTAESRPVGPVAGSCR
ncbi:hypothetical protein PR003_g5193 [Phytophthora rubi]|uniref:Uncharacterized protein n=1 Tax=Phytophthora rubi TaxID=129364 RepID=A0A6A4FTI8_9STRA|nr:hypothetical protein PR002_g15770 [Phytophthora rubi]KAE9350799.1 hypothetical protein PR003_g5193 [Phytophthora rubi]